MWRGIHCAVIGKAHVTNNLPCQDKTKIYLSNDINIIALADGAGSAKHSDLGADIVTEEVINYFSLNFDTLYSKKDSKDAIKEIIDFFIEKLFILADNLKCSIEDLASTLLLVAIKDDKYIICHIGDGAIGYSKNNKLYVASEPDNGEYINSTFFVTSKEAIYKMKIYKGNIGDISGFVIFSDGTESSLYNKKEKIISKVVYKIMELLKTNKEDYLQEKLIESFEKNIRTKTNDDCSIALLVNDKNSKPYNSLNYTEKINFLETKKVNNQKKQILRYDTILNFLDTKKNITQISKKIQLKKKYMKKYLDHLVKKGYVVENNNLYLTVIRTD